MDCDAIGVSGRFNEAAALLPRKSLGISDEAIARELGFNEAAALLPRKSLLMFVLFIVMSDVLQ